MQSCFEFSTTKLASFNFVPKTSVDVERSFSYKNILHLN